MQKLLHHPIIKLITLIRLSSTPRASYLSMCSVCTSLFSTHKVNIGVPVCREMRMRHEQWTYWYISWQRAMSKKCVAFESCVQNVENFIFVRKWLNGNQLIVSLWNGVMPRLFFFRFVSWLKVNHRMETSIDNGEKSENIEVFLYWFICMACEWLNRWTVCLGCRYENELNAASWNWLNEKNWAIKVSAWGAQFETKNEF